MFRDIKNIPDNTVDLVIADLPFGITHAKWDKKLPLDLLWKELLRIGKDTTAYVMFAVGKFSIELAYSNFEYYRYRWVWEKTLPVGFMDAKRKPLKNTEDILVFYKKLPTYNPQMVKGKRHQIGGRGSNGVIYGDGKSPPKGYSDEYYPREILTFPSDKISGHGTVKPVELLRYLIRTYSDKNDIVLDPTMGTGSTGVAAVLENRKFCGIELDSKFFDLANERISKASDSDKDL